MVFLSYQQECSILAGLRVLQDLIDNGDPCGYRNMPHFDDVAPLTSQQIDKLCDQIGCSVVAVVDGPGEGFSISTQVDESEQMSSFQNATLYSTIEGLAMSIAVYPQYPQSINTQDQVKEYLYKHLSPICHSGWNVEVQIGCDVANEGVV